MKKTSTKKTAVGEIVIENKFGNEDISDVAIKAIADAFLPEIIAFYESDEGKQIFEDWKNNNDNKTIS
ncbi:MAG: hypothetical protein IJ279_06310 [Clostridia bacterium]|nr:hypothetical protein [Clostridia bacterium]